MSQDCTPKGACAKASKLYDWDVRNIAKISPKTAKKQPFFDFFRFSQTVHTIQTKFSSHWSASRLPPFLIRWFLGVGRIFRVHMQSCLFFSPDLSMQISNFSKTVDTIFIKYDSNEISYSHSTLQYGPMCALLSYSYDLRFIKEEMEVRKQEFILKTSCAYFKNWFKKGAIWALDVAIYFGYDVEVRLFQRTFSNLLLPLGETQFTSDIAQYFRFPVSSLVKRNLLQI